MLRCKREGGCQQYVCNLHMTKVANRSGCELCQDQIQKDVNIDLLWKMFIVSLVLLAMVTTVLLKVFVVSDDSDEFSVDLNTPVMNQR